MTTEQKVTAYIDKKEQWSRELSAFRTIFISTELKEDFKWGAPIYTLDNKNIVGMVGFKYHLGIWFHQGVFLKDANNKLVLADRSTAKGLRHWKVTKKEPADLDILLTYTLEAIENHNAGKEITVEKKPVIIAPFLVNYLKVDAEFAKAFKQLSRGKQNEYNEHILSAKLDATKKRRLLKIRPLILSGKGLNDKYKS